MCDRFRRCLTVFLLWGRRMSWNWRLQLLLSCSRGLWRWNLLLSTHIIYVWRSTAQSCVSKLSNVSHLRFQNRRHNSIKSTAVNYKQHSGIMCFCPEVLVFSTDLLDRCANSCRSMLLWTIISTPSTASWQHRVERFTWSFVPTAIRPPTHTMGCCAITDNGAFYLHFMIHGWLDRQTNCTAAPIYTERHICNKQINKRWINNWSCRFIIIQTKCRRFVGHRQKTK